MGEILLSRYELFTRTSEHLSISCSKRPAAHSEKRIITHVTNNLSAKEIEERYGNRVRSRMRKLFNLVAFGNNSFDKRF